MSVKVNRTSGQSHISTAARDTRGFSLINEGCALQMFGRCDSRRFAIAKAIGRCGTHEVKEFEIVLVFKFIELQKSGLQQAWK